MPDVSGKVKIGQKEMTTEVEWCSEQLYKLCVQNTQGAALAMVRNLNSQGKARGELAWHRVMREAEGQVETKRGETRGKWARPEPEASGSEGRRRHHRAMGKRGP